VSDRPATYDVRIGPRYDDNGVPYVRLTRTVQSGFGLGVGIALAQLAVFGTLFLLLVVFRLL
jgi:hypothetical protein